MTEITHDNFLEEMRKLRNDVTNAMVDIKELQRKGIIYDSYKLDIPNHLK